MAKNFDQEGVLKLGRVVFDDAEGRRRLELLSDPRGRARDPLRIADLGRYFALKLFPPMRSNMRRQADRWYWVPAIVLWSCERARDRYGDRAPDHINEKLEIDEVKAWQYIAVGKDLAKLPSAGYRYKPRGKGKTWFGSLPSRAYLRTLQRLGLLRHSTPRQLATLDLSGRERNPNLGEVDSAVEKARRVFFTGVERRIEWLRTCAGRAKADGPAPDVPVFRDAEKTALRTLFIDFSGGSLFSLCLRGRLTGRGALANWVGAKTLPPGTQELVRCGGAFVRSREIVEDAWFYAARVNERSLKVRRTYGPAPQRFREQARQLDEHYRVLESYVKDLPSVEAPTRNASVSVSDVRTALVRLGVIRKLSAPGSEAAWKLLQQKYDIWLAQAGLREARFRKPPMRAPEPADDDDAVQAEDRVLAEEIAGLNQWIAEEHVEQLADRK
jgi:hypothetical protein